MKLEIIKSIKEKQIIDIDFPYYYKHDLMLDTMDSVIYGKIEEFKNTAIIITDDYLNKSNYFEFEISIEPANIMGCYMVDKHKSNELEYLTAKSKLITAINST
jgi:hypothetical protein